MARQPRHQARARPRLGVAVGFGARWCFRNLDLPNPGLYPVASIATAALAYGAARARRTAPASSSVYIAALILGTGPVPAQPTTIAFHQGLSWVAQISLFALLGLLVFPSGLGDIAGEGLLLSAALIFVARPLAAFIASAFSPFDGRERLMLGWAGLRGAIPIWLATFPVVAGVGDNAADLQLDLLRRRHLDPGPGRDLRAAGAAARRVSDEPALPPPLIETGIIRRARRRVARLAGRAPGDAAVGRDGRRTSTCRARRSST